MTFKKRVNETLSKNIYFRRLLLLMRVVNRVRKNGTYYKRSIFLLPDKKILYLSVSKAGNTSIKASMYGIPELDNYRAVHRTVRKFHLSRNIRYIGDYPDYFKFTFVRNPFARLVSCYENKLHTDQAKVGKTIRYLIYDSYLMGFLSKDRGFKSFARRVCLIPDRIADRHFVSQSMKAIGPDGKLLVEYVGKLEHMAEDYEPIRQKYDLAPLPHYNKTSKPGKSWMDFYDLDIARRVYNRYKTDIEVFGYQEEYDKLVAYLEAKKAQ